MSSEKERKPNYVAGFFILLAVILSVLALLLFVFGEQKSNDVEVSGGGKNTGLKCTDSETRHPALRDYTPASHTNTIMANFTENDELLAITLYYVGNYNSPSEAKQAEAYAQADYGLILAKEYGVNIDSFSRSFTINGNKVSMTITAKKDSVTDKTAPYFLLEQDKSFPKSLNGMKQRYEGKNFSCEVVN